MLVNRKVMAPHRSWVEAEDNVLVDILTELTLDGKWKSDTGFKSGYLKVIEQKLTEKLPTCGLTTTNIDSRIKTLKKHAMAINEMVTIGSGFEFDYINNKLVCEKSLFDDWAKVFYVFCSYFISGDLFSSKKIYMLLLGSICIISSSKMAVWHNSVLHDYMQVKTFHSLQQPA